MVGAQVVGHLAEDPSNRVVPIVHRYVAHDQLVARPNGPRCLLQKQVGIGHVMYRPDGDRVSGSGGANP